MTKSSPRTRKSPGASRPGYQDIALPRRLHLPAICGSKRLARHKAPATRRIGSTPPMRQARHRTICQTPLGIRSSTVSALPLAAHAIQPMMIVACSDPPSLNWNDTYSDSDYLLSPLNVVFINYLSTRQSPRPRSKSNLVRGTTQYAVRGTALSPVRSWRSLGGLGSFGSLSVDVN